LRQKIFSKIFVETKSSCIFVPQNNNKMKNLSINPEFVSDNNTFKFIRVPSMYAGFFDVMYKGQRIAILNGLSAPLQWTAKNGSNIPVKVIDQLEKMVVKMIIKTNKSK
jgi:hypothetical protein